MIGHYPYPDSDTLLTLKPFLWDRNTETLYPESLPDWEWPPVFTVAQMTCAAHHGVPSEDCTCGIYSSLNLSELYPKYNLSLEQQKELDVIPFLGVIQALGQTLIQDTVVRSKRAYLWGALISTEMYGYTVNRLRGEVSWLREIIGRYRPVLYDVYGADNYEGLKKLRFFLKRSWQYYDIEYGKECLHVAY